MCNNDTNGKAMNVKLNVTLDNEGRKQFTRRSKIVALCGEWESASPSLSLPPSAPLAARVEGNR